MEKEIGRFTPLPRGFFNRPTDEVARDLLGKPLVRRIDGTVLVGKVVEAEAYFGSDDAASHAARGMTKRNAVMFGPPGFAYVYLNYGVHRLLNVVTESEGVPGAVLIRAIEPIQGLELMKAHRAVDSIQAIGSGPGKLTQAMGITLAENGVDMTDSTSGLFFSDADERPPIARSGRIGISAGTEHLLRFYVEGSAFVSRKL